MLQRSAGLSESNVESNVSVERLKVSSGGGDVSHQSKLVAEIKNLEIRKQERIRKFENNDSLEIDSVVFLAREKKKERIV
jgi:hypothetical protein